MRDCTIEEENQLYNQEAKKQKLDCNNEYQDYKTDDENIDEVEEDEYKEEDDEEDELEEMKLKKKRRSFSLHKKRKKAVKKNVKKHIQLQKEEADQTCAICIEKLEIKKSASIECCSHMFCFQCIYCWAT